MRSSSSSSLSSFSRLRTERMLRSSSRRTPSTSTLSADGVEGQGEEGQAEPESEHGVRSLIHDSAGLSLHRHGDRDRPHRSGLGRRAPLAVAARVDRG